MDEEIEEVIENVKQTDSQKSVATSNLYSMDLTDSSSDKHNSSGMDTYVLEWDSEGSESPRYKNIIFNKSVASVSTIENKTIDAKKTFSKECSTSYSKCAIMSQEIFTQTSKTIIELAQNDEAIIKRIDKNTLQTQTSFISIKSNKTVDYHIEINGKHHSKTELANDGGDFQPITNQFVNNSFEDASSKFQFSESDSNTLSARSSEKNINVLNYESAKTLYSDAQNYSEDEFDRSDFEEDSLRDTVKREDPKTDNNNECDTPKSVDRDVAELYNKIYETLDFQSYRAYDQEKKRFGQLTPLTEESAKQDHSQDPTSTNYTSSNDDYKDVLFSNKAGIKVKLFSDVNIRDDEVVKLPPIQGNHSCPTSPKCGNASFIFSMNPNKLQLRSGTLPCVFEERRDEQGFDRWEIGTRQLAAGESQLITDKNDSNRGSQFFQLPPINLEVGYLSSAPRFNKIDHKYTDSSRMDAKHSGMQSPINITDKIKELKVSHKNRYSPQSKYSIHSTSGSRCDSPSSLLDDSKTSETGERGCEMLCVELLKRLRSPSWLEVMDTLDDIPKVLDKFWSVIAEQRIADLLRQVISHVESPRTQVAHTACNSLAAILTNTNYTKKPDFYEAVTILLIKTGSFSRPVRRAANMALDEIVCRVDLSHVVTALCIHGVTHKSPLVRCATARLLVVCCALGGGGRDLLRTRPPTAACARKHALRSLAALLDDKNTDTRKYAERLYSMLRPLTNFEAFYLTDVDVELASRQMKKYDHMLLVSTSDSR